MTIWNILITRITKGDKRSVEAKKNIIVSLITRCIGVIVSLMIVPLTIDYINPTQYGIWLTLSSIIGWISLFDLGLGNGFRNKFSIAKANGNLLLARQYVATTYFALALLSTILFAVAYIVNYQIDWSNVLNVDNHYKIQLQITFNILAFFFCFQIFVNTFGTLLTADQKPGWSSTINAIGQLVSLLVIFILTKCTIGSLTKLAFYYSGIPSIVMLISTIIMFSFSSYRIYKPRIKDIKPNLIKDILGLGVEFFFIYICLIAIFQIINIVISREIGPIAVTQYNIANRYFNIIAMTMTIIITPIWSAFTDAYTQRDFVWMKKIKRKLEYIWLIMSAIGVVLLLLSSFSYKIWIGNSVNIPFFLSVVVFIYTICQMIGNIYMYMINGIGTVRLQLIIYIVFAVLSWPCLQLSCKVFGITGVLIIPSLAFLAQAIIGNIQLNKLINEKAKGLWVK